MERDKAKELKFTEYLDRVLAGEEVIPGDEMDAELRSVLDFARTMLAGRDEPSPDFRAHLRESLLQKLAAQEEASSTRSRTKFLDWLGHLSPQQPVWRFIASAALVVLLIVAGAVWYNRASSPEQTALRTPQLQDGGYSVQLPSRAVPDQISFSVTTSLSAKTGQAALYQAAAPDVTAQSVTSLGRKLGFSGEAEFTDGGEKLRMTDGTGIGARELIVWTASGAVEYGFVSSEKLNPLDSPELPSMAEAKKLAYSFLEQADLVPPDYRSFFRVRSDIIVIAGGSYSISDRNTGQVIQKDPTYWVVSFPYYVQGIQATGPGARIEVRIGDKGEVLQLIWAWRQLSPLYNGKVISEKSAYANLVSGDGSLDVPQTCDQVIVKRVTLSYWINALSEQQEYVLPVYEFMGECLNSGGQHLEDFTAWTEALLKTY